MLDWIVVCDSFHVGKDTTLSTGSYTLLMVFYSMLMVQLFSLLLSIPSSCVFDHEI